MSLLPLGILSSSGAGGAAAFELISTQILTSGTATITFASIPSTYKHLQIRSVAKSTGGYSYLDMQFNSDTGSNYAWHRLYGSGSVGSSSSSSQTKIRLNMSISESGTANAFTPLILDIMDYSNTSKNKTVKALSGQTDWNVEIDFSSGLWLSNSAISSISLNTGSTNIAVGSRFSLYGVKGS